MPVGESAPAFGEPASTVSPDRGSGFPRLRWLIQRQLLSLPIDITGFRFLIGDLDRIDHAFLSINNQNSTIENPSSFR